MIPSPRPPQTRLDEFTKLEWWDVARRIRPDMTAEEYDRIWDEFVALKARKALQ